MRDRLYGIILLAAFAICAKAQIRWNSAYQNYINKYKDIAIEQMLEHKIPASITLAQGLLESGAGKSVLATKGNNHFGIKCHNTWTGPTMSMDDDARGECFRVYHNARASYEDHSKFLKQPRYQRLYNYGTKDYKAWAKGLKACGYATNPQYASQLIGIIELYHLDKYDEATSYDKWIADHVRGLTHEIKSFNDNYYVIVKKGDTFKSIGREVSISARKLAKFNERDKHDELMPGEIVYLKKKKKKAPKEFRYRPHVVKAGQSMYDIAQMYGMRVKYLYKKNDLDPEVYVPKPGDLLRVR